MSANDDRPSGKKPRSYTVGYGHPPVSTRFQPGNRAAARRHGRQTSAQDLLTKVMLEKVTVTQGGTSRRMHAYEAMIRSMSQKALNGDPRAQDRLIKYWDRFNFRPRNYAPVNRDLRPELRDRIEQMVRRNDDIKK